MRTFTPLDVVKEVSKTVIGQDQAKKDIALALCTHFTRICSVEEDALPPVNHALIMGPSGSGKTMIVKATMDAIKKISDADIIWPFFLLDATALTPSGYHGVNLVELIETAIVSSELKPSQSRAAEYGVFFMDEFDKICVTASDRSGSDFNKQKQYDLLKALEGINLNLSIHGRGITKVVNTANMLFIFAGNFPWVRKARELKKTPMGFTTPNPEDVYSDGHTEIMEGGVVTQLAGRIVTVTETSTLSKDELRQILRTTTLPISKRSWKALGKHFQIPEEVKDTIIEHTFKRGTGARGLFSELHAYVKDQLLKTRIRCHMPSKLDMPQLEDQTEEKGDEGSE